MEGCAARASIPASSPCTWPSTITRAWPSPRCSPIRRPKPPSPACPRRSTSLPTTASAFALCLPTTAPATAPTCTAQLAKICSSNTAVPSPTLPEPTAKRNASSKPPCASGPMQSTGQTQSKETPTCSHGPTTTTTSGHMVASATSRPSADPTLVQRLDHLQPPAYLKRRCALFSAVTIQRPSGAPQHPFRGDVSYLLPTPQAAISLLFCGHAIAALCAPTDKLSAD